jgi:hypothetical protein
MKVLVNGFPKSGTHAAAKAVELLGVPCIHAHWPHPKLPEHTHHVFIKRDPRNVLLSWIRASGNPLTEGMTIRYIRQFITGSLVDDVSAFVGWLHQDTFVMRFEDLIANDAEMRRLAKFLEVPYLDDAFPNLPGHTTTWTGKYSDYRAVWTPQIESAWNAEGGHETLEAWGY